MMKFGASNWIWTSPFSDADTDLMRRARTIGFDVFEIAVERTEGITAPAVRRIAKEIDISISICGAFGTGRDLAHEDPERRAAARDYLRFCCDLAEAVGSPHVCGPMYSAVGKERVFTPDGRKREHERLVVGLRAAASYASDRGVRLAIEPLNRYETDIVNTVGQGLELCEEIGLDNVGLLLDTYHMNIEEKSLRDAILLAGRLLFHFQVSENDRGTVGTGHTPWEDVFKGLHEVGYEGYVVIESFTADVQEIARAVSLWRTLDAAGDVLASQGLAFLKGGLAATP